MQYLPAASFRGERELFVFSNDTSRMNSIAAGEGNES